MYGQTHPSRASRALATCALACLVALAGCRSLGTRVGEEQLQRFQVGATTYYDVVAALGKPSIMIRDDKGQRQVTYIYQQEQMSWQNFFPISDGLAGGASTEQTTAVLNFDPEDILLGYSVTQGNLRSGHGLFSGAKQ